MHSENVNDMVLVRRILGFAKIGCAVDLQLVKSTQGKYQALVDAGVLKAEGTRSVATALGHLGAGILPTVDLCRKGMAEVDEVLLPMRQSERAADSMVVKPTPRRERS